MSGTTLRHRMRNSAQAAINPAQCGRESTYSGCRVRNVPHSLFADQAGRRHLRPCPWRRAVVTFACRWRD